MSTNRAPVRPLASPRRMRVCRSVAAGMMPRGNSSTTARRRPPNITSRIAPASAPPRVVLVYSLSGTTIAAPSNGPQIVPLPPSSTASTICMLNTMSNMDDTVRMLR